MSCCAFRRIPRLISYTGVDDMDNSSHPGAMRNQIRRWMVVMDGISDLCAAVEKRVLI